MNSLECLNIKYIKLMLVWSIKSVCKKGSKLNNLIVNCLVFDIMRG